MQCRRSGCLHVLTRRRLLTQLLIVVSVVVVVIVVIVVIVVMWQIVASVHAGLMVVLILGVTTGLPVVCAMRAFNAYPPYGTRI